MSNDKKAFTSTEDNNGVFLQIYVCQCDRGESVRVVVAARAGTRELNQTDEDGIKSMSSI